MPLMEIRGMLVDTRYLYATIAWYIAVIALWPILVVGLKRAIIAYRVSGGKLVDNLVYWVHIALIVVCLTIVAIDPASIYFGMSGRVNLFCLLEITILNYSHVVYSFVCSVQHYIVQSKLSSPPWINKFKWHFVIFNFSVGNIALVATLAADRVYVSGLTPIVCALEGVVVGPVFIVLVLRLTNRLKAQFTSINSQESTNVDRVLKGIKKIRSHTFLSVALMFLFATIVFAVYIPRTLVDKSLVHSNTAEYPDFARHRGFKSTFKFNWIMWVAYFISSYFLYGHWIKKSSYAGKLSVKLQGPTTSYNSRQSTYADKVTSAQPPTPSRGSDNSRQKDASRQFTTSRQYTSTASSQFTNPALRHSEPQVHPFGSSRRHDAPRESDASTRPFNAGFYTPSQESGFLATPYGTPQRTVLAHSAAGAEHV